MVSSPVAESIVTPVGAPLIANVGAGVPVAVTWNVPPVPVTLVVLAALVIAGGAVTVSVKVCVSSGDTPLLAVIVMV